MVDPLGVLRGKDISFGGPYETVYSNLAVGSCKLELHAIYTYNALNIVVHENLS